MVKDSRKSRMMGSLRSRIIDLLRSRMMDSLRSMLMRSVLVTLKEVFDGVWSTKDR